MSENYSLKFINVQDISTYIFALKTGPKHNYSSSSFEMIHVLPCVSAKYSHNVCRTFHTHFSKYRELFRTFDSFP